MAKEIIAHHLTDWSKVDEKAGFWGRIDLLRPEINIDTMTIYGQADRLVLDDYMIEMVCQYKIMAKSMY